MASDGEGTIRIPFDEFYKFVLGYAPKIADAETLIGIPRFEADDVVIDYAWSTSCHPAEWANEPEVLKQLQRAGVEGYGNDWKIPHRGGCQGKGVQGWHCENPQCGYRGGDSE